MPLKFVFLKNKVLFILFFFSQKIYFCTNKYKTANAMKYVNVKRVRRENKVEPWLYLSLTPSSVWVELGIKAKFSASRSCKHNLLNQVHKNIIIIGDPLETEMYDRISIGDRCLIGYPSETDMLDQAYPMGLRSVRLVFDPACLFPMSLRSGMLVSDQTYWSPIRHVGLQ